MSMERFFDYQAQIMPASAPKLPTPDTRAADSHNSAGGLRTRAQAAKNHAQNELTRSAHADKDQKFKDLMHTQRAQDTAKQDDRKLENKDKAAPDNTPNTVKNEDKAQVSTTTALQESVFQNDAGLDLQSLQTALHTISSTDTQTSLNKEADANTETDFVQTLLPSQALSQTLSETLALNTQSLDKAIDPSISSLTKGIITTKEIEQGSPRILQALLLDPTTQDPNLSGKLSALKAKLQSLLKDGGQGLLSTNLTPEQITALQNAKNGEIPDELAGMMVALVQILPPPAQAGNTGAVQHAELENDPDVQNLMAALTPPAAKTPLENNEALSNTSAFAPDDVSQDETGEIKDFKATLQDLKGGTPENTDKSAAAPNMAAGPHAKVPTDSAPPNFSALQGWPFDLEGSLFAPANIAGQDPLAAMTSSMPAPSIQMGSLTSLVTQAHSASAPHPATQMLAVQIQKTTQQGENRTFTMEMDPPELGRVNVRMVFGKDKTVKLTVITEKPETYMMLQRDSHVLERVIENAGLTSDGGLSFELAEHGQDFGAHHGHEQGTHTSGQDTSEPSEILQSTMTWHVDSETGHTRYNILA